MRRKRPPIGKKWRRDKMIAGEKKIKLEKLRKADYERSKNEGI